MPWVRRGDTIYKKVGGGKLRKKQKCKSASAAKAALRLLYSKGY